MFELTFNPAQTEVSAASPNRRALSLAAERYFRANFLTLFSRGLRLRPETRGVYCIAVRYMNTRRRDRQRRDWRAFQSCERDVAKLCERLYDTLQQRLRASMARRISGEHVRVVEPALAAFTIKQDIGRRHLRVCFLRHPRSDFSSCASARIEHQGPRRRHLLPWQLTRRRADWRNRDAQPPGGVKTGAALDLRQRPVGQDLARGKWEISRWTESSRWRSLFRRRFRRFCLLTHGGERSPRVMG